MEEETVQPTFVMFLPTACKNSKKVELIAKHGSLIFAITSFICMIMFHLNTNDHLWLLFLPPCVFYSLIHIAGCVSDNKIIQVIQIIVTYILLDYSCYLSHFTKSNFTLNFAGNFFLLFLSIALDSNAISLQIVHRKRYVTNLATPESFATLNIVDYCHFTLFFANLVIFTVLLPKLKALFPFYIYKQAEPEMETYRGIIGFLLLSGLMIFTYIWVFYYNRTKTMVSLSYVDFDSDGRAWCCLFGRDQIGRRLKQLKCWNRSSVKPEESQKLPLKLPK